MLEVSTLQSRCYRLGGFLAFESEWNPPLGKAMEAILYTDIGEGRLDLGCVAAHGQFEFDNAVGKYGVTVQGKPATAFLFQLISRLQFVGTVPMIDMHAYAIWLTKS
jgi:hypothetical protein